MRSHHELYLKKTRKKLKLLRTDYEKIGLKVGLEIHQQLDTSTKLFCNCQPSLFNEDPEITTKMINKRMKKLYYMTQELKEKNIETIKVYGPENAKTTIISWGSTKGPIREAMKILNKNNEKINYLQILYLVPFPKRRIEQILKGANNTIVVENSKSSQISSLIREHLLRKADYEILKFDGRPFNPSILAKKIKEVL